MEFKFKNIYYYIIFVYLFFPLQLYCQSNCDCGSASKEISLIEIEIDKRNFENLQQRISKLPVNKDECIKFQQLIYLQYFIEQNLIREADSLLLKISNHNSQCQQIQIRFLYCKGNYFVKKAKSDSALYYLFKSHDLARELIDPVFQSKALGRIAFVFNNYLSEPLKSLSYNKKAIAVLQGATRKDLLLLHQLNRLAYYGRAYDKYENVKFLDSIYLGSLPALQLAKELKIPQRIGQTYSLIAGVYYVRNDYHKTIAYCDSGLLSIDYSVDSKNKHALYTKKCDAYYALKNYSKSTQFADSSLRYAQIENVGISIVEALERLYEINKTKGDFQKSLQYLEQIRTLVDSINDIENKKSTTELEKKYNQAQNLLTIKELSHEKEINEIKLNVILTILVLITILIWLLLTVRNNKNKSKILEVEQRLNRLRMNPHFFFNSLASLQKFSLQGNTNELSVYIAKLSKIMRQTLESSFTEFVTIDNEIEFLTNYLQVQKLMNENKFDFDINADGIEDITSQKIPTMLLQPFVENSIEHAFNGLQKMGMIEILFEQENEFVKILIKDNGLSSLSNKSEKSHVSRALQIIDDRIFLLNKVFKSNARYDINFGNDGTVVEIFLPPLFHS